MNALNILSDVDETFRLAAESVDLAPTRFYLNLTEICQLRCAHCITDAPARTLAKTARHMSPEVLEALRPHLAHATYVGLVHAGEPMLSPAFEPLLTLLAEARRGAPTMVHLLTNGMAMTEERFLDVVRRGVRSISFSIDGMSEASNDAIRQGSRIAVLKERLPRLVALRRAQGLDVRLGLSFTVMAANHHEVVDAVRFASDAGLDWLKIEEVVAVNAFAERQVLPVGALAEVARRAVAAADRGLVVVDHTVEHEVWRCSESFAPDLSSEMRAFAAADSFANRVDINPCRMPYEAVFVEPDGEVKAVDFHHPPVGSLLEQDLRMLFNAEGFRLWRRRQRLHRLCGRGPAECPPDYGPLP